MESSFADRYLNEGFSGGERKRNEVLQMAVLQPDLAIMDEKLNVEDGCAFNTVRVLANIEGLFVGISSGAAVHAALQSFHLARWRGGDDSPEAVAAAYEKSFNDLERDEGPVKYKDADAREKARQDGLRVVAAYLDSPEAMKEKPRAVEVLLKEDIPGLSVPLTGAMDLVENNFTPVDFKSAAAKPDPANAAWDHEIQLVSYQLLLEAIGETPPSLDLVFLVKTKTPQVIRVQSPPADAHRKRRVTALLETAAEGIAAGRHHPQPGMHCSWCQYRNECRAWLPSLNVQTSQAA